MKKLIFPPQLKGVTLSTELHDFFLKSARYANIDKKDEIDLNLFVYTVLADETDNIVLSVLEAMKVDLNILFESLKEKRIKNTEQKNSDHVTLSEELTKITLSAYKKTSKTKNTFETIDLFLTILKTNCSVTQTFIDNAIEHIVFKQTYDELQEFYDEDSESEPSLEIEYVSKKPLPNFTKQEKQIHTLIEKFTTNLNAEYEKGNISDCIGREMEIETLERVLGRTNKKNAILVGKAGVGKTQIVEGLVKKICTNSVAPHLQNKIVLALNINDLEAGTSWRGQLEERIKLLIDFLNTNENVILFIDEIHSIIGVGRSTNADLSNALKPFLTKGKIQIIGATTTDEYQQYIEDKKAFTRRFFVQHIEELSKEDTLTILKEIKHKYEDFHGVKYSIQILTEIVNFCDKYLKNRAFPDKAIDIVDDLGATVKMHRKLDRDLITINKKMNELKITKKYIIQNKKYESSEKILLSEKKLKEDLNRILNRQESKPKQNITKEIFISYLKKSYKIADYYGENFEGELEGAEKRIKEVLFGQDEVVDGVLSQIRIKKLFDDYSNPSVFFFLGNSGVGKTFLAELLATHLYQNKLKVVSGELFKEQHSVANLVGSPKGYVDSDKGSDIFEFIKYNPESILVFDEIEKAHPDFYDMLLTILDKGLITDKNGDIIDVRRCLIIFTSNIGAENLKFPLIGYNAQKQDNTIFFEKGLNKRFKQEFINRIDEIFYFKDIDNFEHILAKEFEKIQMIMKQRDVELTLSEETKSEILLEIQNNKEGAIRTLRRAITKKIKNKIAAEYLKTKALVV